MTTHPYIPHPSLLPAFMEGRVSLVIEPISYGFLDPASIEKMEPDITHHNRWDIHYRKNESPLIIMYTECPYAVGDTLLVKEVWRYVLINAGRESEFITVQFLHTYAVLDFRLDWKEHYGEDRVKEELSGMPLSGTGLQFGPPRDSWELQNEWVRTRLPITSIEAGQLKDLTFDNMKALGIPFKPDYSEDGDEIDRCFFEESVREWWQAQHNEPWHPERWVWKVGMANDRNKGGVK